MTQNLVLGKAEYIKSDRGRELQIARGLSRDQEWLLILHADSEITTEMRDELADVLKGPPSWGRFNVSIPGLPVIAMSMNWRSRLTKICTGDQGMFFHQDLLDEFPDQPLMEDIELSKRLKRRHSEKFVPLKSFISTSPRRWQQRGVVRTIITMWSYRIRYYLGTSAETLYAEYYQRNE